jgi:arsenate reductase (thioredoxin)
MAEGFLKSFSDQFDVHSAGTAPASRVHPRAIAVMNELGIEIGRSLPKSVDRYVRDSFDYVITVCDHAKESCPVFSGKVRHRIHIGFDDPVGSRGTEEEVMDEFRRVRDEIRERFQHFAAEALKPPSD